MNRCMLKVIARALMMEKRRVQVERTKDIAVKDDACTVLPD